MKVLILLAALVALAASAPHLNKPFGDRHKLHDRSALFPGYVPKTRVMPRMNSGSRIVGGNEADRHEYPHQVTVTINAGSFCGGSLVHPNWVLTAAHCCQGAVRIVVEAGRHDLSADEADRTQSKTVDTINQHEEYGQFLLHNDVCLLYFAEAFETNDYVDVVALASDSPPVDTVVTASGWGKPSDAAGGINQVLKEADVRVIDNAECASFYGATVIESCLCVVDIEGDTAGGGGTVDGTCNGDSGGPLNYMGTTIGVTSFVSSSGCQSGLPDGFARVSSFLDWIEATTGGAVVPPSKK